MFTRLAAALCSILFLAACEQEASKNICKGLNKTDCTAKSHCEWNAEKDKCIKKKERAPAADEPASEAPAATEAAPSAETPPAADAEPSPSEPSMGEPPSPSQPQPVYPDGPGLSTGPETSPGDTPPQ
jgi:hypothetical protein